MSTKTKSKIFEVINMCGDEYCNECGEKRGHPNSRDKRGRLVFICSHCKRGEDMSIERAEQRLGA